MQPTRTRYTIILLVLVINLICYTDRSCISIAGPKMREEFGFSQIQMGLVYSIFSLSYFLGQTPWGILSDRYGARWLVALAIAGWSIFTGVTGLAYSFVSLLAIRFVFGGLEAALSPAVATAFNRWIPERERASAFGFFLGGGRLGAAITPFFAAMILVASGWRVMFLVFGGLGILSAVAWMLWFRNTPGEHPAVNAEELRLIESRGPKALPLHRPEWRELLRSDRFWSLLAVSFGCTFMWQFYITWFPTYLREKLHMSLQESSVYAGLPFLLGVFGTWLGGLLTDWLSRRYDVRQARTVVGGCSLTMGGILLSTGIWCSEPKLAAVLMAGGALGVDLFLGAAWASAVEIGGARGGAVAGAMNAASNFAGFLSPTFNGWVLETFHDWNVFLIVAVAINLIAAALWLRVNPRRLAAVVVLVMCVSLEVQAQRTPLEFDIKWVNPPDRQVVGLTHHTLHSKAIGQEVGFNLYLPSGYAKSIDRYPVLYWLHGASGDESSRPLIAEQFHRAIETKVIPPAILVIPNGGKRSEYRDWEPQRVMVETFLIRELIPHIDARYRTIAERRGRHIEGMSMGGNGALKLAFKYPAMFGSVVAYAGSYRPLPIDSKSEWVRKLAQWYSAEDDVFVLAKRNAAKLQDMRIRLVIGTKDVSWADSEALHGALQGFGVAHEYEALLGVAHDNTAYYERAGERGFAFHAMAGTRVEAIHYREKLRLLTVKPEGWKAGDKRMAILWIHGGGWTAGAPDRFVPHAAYYARKGAVGFSVEYRLAKPPLAIEDAVDDVRAAVRYVRDHASDLGVDASRIVVAGDSAGGHLALMTAVERPAAIIDCNGIPDVTNPKWSARARDARAVSPLFQIGPAHPPVLILHGMADTVVLPAESERYHAALKAAGVRTNLVTWPDAQHAFVVPEYQASTEVILRALREVDLFMELR